MIWVVVSIVGFLLIWGVLTYNALVRGRNETRNATMCTVPVALICGA